MAASKKKSGSTLPHSKNAVIYKIQYSMNYDNVKAFLSLERGGAGMPMLRIELRPYDRKENSRE